MQFQRDVPVLQLLDSSKRIHAPAFLVDALPEVQTGIRVAETGAPALD
jgi:hypothetical protein